VIKFMPLLAADRSSFQTSFPKKLEKPDFGSLGQR